MFISWSRRIALAWTRTIGSGARGLLVDSVACAVAVRVVDGAGVDKGDAESVARSRRAMARCTREAGVVAKAFLVMFISSLITQA